MKVKVNRELRNGQYHISFEVSNFAVEEVTQMQKFGVPMINMRWNTAAGATTGPVALNKITPTYDAFFNNEQQAIDYEQQVMNQIKAAIEALRTKKDNYSTSTEVDF